MTILVTGASGLIGSHLVEFLAGRGESVVALTHHAQPGIAGHPKIETVSADLLDRARLTALLADVRPDVLYHLAAQSLPGESWRDPQQTFRVNVEGTLNLLDAARAADNAPRIVIACSSAEYAIGKTDEPIREDHRLEPSSPYGASKLAAEHLAWLYGLRYGLQIVRARPFFLIGPRKTGDVCSDFARGIVAVERGREPVLSVGNLDAVRDLLDVRDGVRACAMLAERGQAGEAYNICSGRGWRMREVLDKLKKMAHLPIKEMVDPGLLRPIDEPVRIGDPSKLQALGWRPDCAIEDTLRRILEYWRSVE